jgi:hypothetical protein
MPLLFMATPAVYKPNPTMCYFTSIACKNPIHKSVEELVKEIQNPSKDVATLIASIRKASSSGEKKEATRLKKGLPAVTVSGIFEGGHLIANLKELNGLIQVDLDNVFDLTDLRNQLRKDPIILCEFLSPSGNGSKSIVRYTGNFEAAFHELTQYFQQRYSVTMDQVCKDVSRLMFLSHDPDCYYNPVATFFKASNEVPKPEPKKAPEMPKSNAIPEGVTADVEKVVNQITKHKIDITGRYEDWLKLGFALASEFGLGGLGYFHKISQYSPTYDPHTCEKQYQACCRNTGTSKASIKTFFGMAKEYGIDIKPVYRKTENNPKTARKQPEKAVSDQPRPTDTALIPDDSQEMLHRVIEDTAVHFIEEDFQQENGFFIQNSAYWITERGNGKNYNLEVSNFVMEILFHFDDDSKNTRRLIKLQRNTGNISVVEVQDNETSPEKFEVILKSKKCTFFGKAYTLKRIFKYCMDNELSAKAIITLGYNPDNDIYALSDSIVCNGRVERVNEVGIVKTDKTTFYLPAWSSYNRENTAFVNERRFRYIEGAMNFSEWAENFYQAYDLNGAIGICYIIQCLFRDIIFSQINFFPFLFLFGAPGVGKTTYIDLLLRLWGDKEPGVSVKGSTIKAIARAASQRRNALLFLKEYDNTISPDLENALKNFYDGQGYSTAQTSNDNKTQTWLVHSGIVIDGNALPTKSNAFFDRNIVLTFEQNKFTKESTAAYNRLMAASEGGLGQVLVEILSHRKTFEKNIKPAFNCIYNQIKGYDAEFEGVKFPADSIVVNGFDLSKLPERTIKHIAFILGTVIALDGHINFSFDYSQLVQKVFMDAIEKHDLMAEINEVSMFWDALSYTHKAEPHRVTEGKHYQKEPLELIIYIKINELYPVYVDYCKRSNINFCDKTTLVKLLTSESYPAFIPGDQKGRGKAITKHQLGSCYRFRYVYPKDFSDNILIAGKEVNL